MLECFKDQQDYGKIAINLLKNPKMQNSIFGRSKNLDEQTKIQRLERLLEKELRDIDLDFFTEYAISHDGGLSVQYYGAGAIKLYKERAALKNLPAITEFEFQVVYKSPINILMNQNEWTRLSNTAVYSIPSDMVYGLEIAQKKAQVGLQILASRKKEAQKEEAKEEVIDEEFSPILWVKRMTNPKGNDGQNVVGCYGWYKTSDGRKCKVYWSLDIFGVNVGESSPYYKYPLQQLETKFLLACYRKEYGKAFVKQTDEETRNEELIEEEEDAHTQKARLKAEASLATMAEETKKPAGGELD